MIAPGKEDALEAIDPGGVGRWEEQYPFGVDLIAADRDQGMRRSRPSSDSLTPFGAEREDHRQEEPPEAQGQGGYGEKGQVEYSQ